jgi:hypothetical protein
MLDFSQISVDGVPPDGPPRNPISPSPALDTLPRTMPSASLVSPKKKAPPPSELSPRA